MDRRWFPNAWRRSVAAAKRPAAARYCERAHGHHRRQRPLRWTLTQNAPLQGLNTFHVQANAEQLLELHDAALLPEVLALPEVANGPLLVLGASNVLIAEDLPGTVLVFGNRDISFLTRADHAVIRAGAACPGMAW